MFRLADTACTLAYLKVQVAFLGLAGLFDAKANFNKLQPRDNLGKWCLGPGCTQVGRIERTGNTRIDARTDLLVDVVREVTDLEGSGVGPLYGIRIHRSSAQAIRALNLPGTGATGVEQSFSAGDLVRYGLQGSIRTDIVMREGGGTQGAILAVWDIKTGSARLTKERAADIRKALGVGTDVPIIEIHIDLGVDTKAVRTRLFGHRPPQIASDLLQFRST